MRQNGYDLNIDIYGAHIFVVSGKTRKERGDENESNY